MAVLVYTPVAASGEPPIEAHLVAPAGAEVRANPQGPLHDDHGSFLDGIEDLDVHRQGGAVGIVQRGLDHVLITVVRLRNEDEAARALTAFGNGPPDDARIEVLPEFVPDTITHRIKDTTLGNDTTIVEVTRATSRDLVVFAQLDLNEPNLTLFTGEVVSAHLAAFPAVTPPAAGSRPWGWLLPVVVGSGTAVTTLGVATLRRRRKRILSSPPTPIDPSRIRVNW